MRALSAAELLEVWEAGFAQASTERALALLAAACPESSRDTLAAMSIGRRDAELLALRDALWGPRMEAVVVCPGCRDRLEMALNTREFLSCPQPALPGAISLSMAGYDVSFRLPTTLDVMEAAGQAGTGDQESCPRLVFQRCLLSARQGNESVTPDQLPAEVVDGIAKRMGEADALAEIQLQVTCPSCQHAWRALFDVVSFLWTEIEVWAWRILSDVHTLASAYGWDERDILALSPTRRQFYLEMVGA